MILFMNPSNGLDAWDIKYGWLPAAEKYDTSLDLVDIVPSTSIGTTGAPPSDPSVLTATDGGQSGLPSQAPQSLAQMATTMVQAAKAWGLPSWVHLYEISAATAKAWGMQYGIAADANTVANGTQSAPTLWLFYPPRGAGEQPPVMSVNVPGATVSVAQAMTWMF